MSWQWGLAVGADYGSWQWELISDIIGGIVTLGSHTVAVAMPGSQARVQPNKVKLSKNGPHVRAMDLGPKTMEGSCAFHPVMI